MHDSAVGTIVNVASGNAFIEPDAGVLDYGARQDRARQPHQSLAREFGPHRIRVNALSRPRRHRPLAGAGGVAQTVAGATGVDADSAREQVLAGIGGLATRRLTTPEELATLITLLASPRLDNVIGVNYVIDDGLIKTT